MKPVVITIACNSSREIRLSEVAPSAQNIEIEVGECAQVRCIDDRVFTQNVLDVSIRCTIYDNAQFFYCDMRQFCTDATVRTDTIFTAHTDAVIRFEQWQLGGKKIKLTVDAQLQGERSEIDVRCGARLHDDQKQNIYTIQSHRAPGTKSNCVIKVIASGMARSVYEGMIEIEPIAQKSEAFQTHKAIVTSDSAYAYARPSLQVQTDDVQCGHGSAIGQIDELQRDYICARGLSEDHARILLLHAFLDDLYSIEHMRQIPLTIGLENERT